MIGSLGHEPSIFWKFDSMSSIEFDVLIKSLRSYRASNPSTSKRYWSNHGPYSRCEEPLYLFKQPMFSGIRHETKMRNSYVHELFVEYCRQRQTTVSLLCTIVDEWCILQVFMGSTTDVWKNRRRQLLWHLLLWVESRWPLMGGSWTTISISLTSPSCR